MRAHYQKKNLEAEEKRIARLKEMADDSEIERQRREAKEAFLSERKSRPILQRMGLQRPEE